jgi:hypothetical protein
MSKRAGKRLLDLYVGRSTWVVRESVILTPYGSEFRLQKQILPSDMTIFIGTKECCAHSLFKIVFSLVRGIQGAKTQGQGSFHTLLGSLLFPSGTIDEVWHVGWHQIFY